MKVIKNDSTVEDVTPVEEPTGVTVDPEADKELIAEMALANMVARFKPTIRDLYNYIRYKKISIDQAKEEIANKTSELTKSRREFLLAFKSDYIQELFDYLIKLHRSNQVIKSFK